MSGSNRPSVFFSTSEHVPAWYWTAGPCRRVDARVTVPDVLAVEARLHRPALGAPAETDVAIEGFVEAKVTVYPGLHGESTIRDEFLKALMLGASSTDGLAIKVPLQPGVEVGPAKGEPAVERAPGDRLL
jgi:hypothetical protein